MFEIGQGKKEHYGELRDMNAYHGIFTKVIDFKGGLIDTSTIGV